MNTRIIAILIIITHLSGNLSCALSGAGLSEGCAFSAPEAFVVDSNLSGMIAVVNKNLCQQVKLLSGLISFSSALADKALPIPKKDKDAKNPAPVGIVPPSSFFSQIKQAATYPAAKGPVAVYESVTANIIVLSYLFIAGLFIRRQRFGKCFFHLPRGGICDAIMVLKIFPINPHWLKANGDFL